MTSNDEKFLKYLDKNPQPRKAFFDRPYWTRRRFFEILGAGVTGSYLATRGYADGVSTAPTTPINRAKNVIFILNTGAMSHTDTFDLKEGSWTPADFTPTTINGLRFPAGLFPKMAANIPDIAIVRSMRAYALVHSLGQTWSQIGRNPAAALGDIAPNIGSIVALEKEKDRLPSQVFPTFLALNSPGAIGSGFLSSKYSPFKTFPSSSGLPNVTNPDGEVRLNDRFSFLHSIDDPLRAAPSPLGKDVEDMDSFYTAAKGLTYNSAVNNAFGFSTADSIRYGSSSVGNACLVAKQVLAAGQGTRFVLVSNGSWDMHQNIYDKQQNPRGNLYYMASQLDNAVSTLIGDLKSSGLFDSTMLVMVSEFGRTVGKLNPANGRDHLLQQYAMFAGAGIKGGRAIGSTTPDGSATQDPGWSANRDVRPEDIEATIYDAMGIDYTYVNYNDPFHRGFEYVPGGGSGVHQPIRELWTP